MLLSVIVVSYNTHKLTVAALKSTIDEIEKSQLLSGNSEIIFVDNHSSDNTVSGVTKLFQKTHPRRITTKILVNTENLGFSQANNQGIATSTGKYIMLLNSDTLVLPKALETLVKTFENTPIHEATAHLSTSHKKTDRLGIIASTLLNQDESIQPQGGSLPTLFTVFNQMLFLDDLPLVGTFLRSTQATGKNAPQSKNSQFKAQLQSMGWVGGAAVMIRREVIDEIGSLDENIFMYGEDIEFCLRARKHHWDIVIHPGAEIIHLGSASSSQAHAVQGEIEGYLYIWSKHMPFWQVPLLKSILYTGIMLRIFLFGIIFNDSKKFETYKKALSSL